MSLKRGTGTPASARQRRIACLSRAVLTAGSELALSPRRWLIAAATTVVWSSTGTTASIGRRRAKSATVAAHACGSAKSSVSSESGESASNVLGRSESQTSPTPSLPAASTNASVRYVVVGRRSSNRPDDTGVSLPRRRAGLCFAGSVVGVASGRVVGGVENFGDFGNLFLDQPLDALLQRDVCGTTALAATAHLEIDPVILHVDELHEAAVAGHRGVDHRVDQLLHAGLEFFAHAAPLDRYFTRVSTQGQLALRGLRSAEPGLGEPRRPLAIGGRRRNRSWWRARQAIGELAHALEGDRNVFAPVGGRPDNSGDLGVQRFHARIRVRPAVIELILDQLAQERTERRALEQQRPGRNQQPDRILHGIDGVDEPVRFDEVQELAIILERGPRRERHPGGPEREAGLAREPDHGLDVRARVPLVEVPEDRIVQRLRGRDDEGAAETRQLRQTIAVMQQVLDLRREVERELAKLLVERARGRHRVARAVEKIRIAERDV